jgi:hypothetical protein
MTPEQTLRNHFQQRLKKMLPKGRYLLQPIETNTIGVPDFYLSWLVGIYPAQLWIETKTTEYVLDRFQLNWALLHARTGQPTMLLTAPGEYLHYARTPPNTANTAPHSPSSLYGLPYASAMLDYSTLGAYIKKEGPLMIPLLDILAYPDVWLGKLFPVAKEGEEISLLP